MENAKNPQKRIPENPAPIQDVIERLRGRMREFLTPWDSEEEFPSEWEPGEQEALEEEDFSGEQEEAFPSEWEPGEQEALEEEEDFSSALASLKVEELLKSLEPEEQEPLEQEEVSSSALAFLKAEELLKSWEASSPSTLTPPQTAPNLPPGPLGATLTREVPPPRYTPSLAHLVEKALDRYDLGLSPAERYVYAHLLTAGLYRLKFLGKPITKALRQVTVFLPVDSLAATLGIPRRTLTNVLNSLRDRGLVARRAWVTVAMVHGWIGAYRAGMVFAIRLPNRDGRARVYPEDLQHPWRDLDDDMEAGRTAWAELQAWRKEQGGRRTRRRPWEGMSSFAKSILDVKEGRGGVTRLEALLKWSLPPEILKKGLDIDSAKQVVGGPEEGPEELVSRLAQAKSSVRRHLVEEMALGLAKEFRDPGSTRFYAWVIWNAFRANLYGYAPEAMRVFVWAVERVREALRSGKLRRPGALMAKLLRDQGLIDLFRRAPKWRVA
ncbi:MAG: hypothetical protein ACK4ZX_06715 [Thermus sp.]